MAKNQKDTTVDPKTAAEKTEAAVSESVDKDLSRGLRGTEVDQTPNENYTLAGVTSGKPTPETDADQKKKAQGDN